MATKPVKKRRFTAAQKAWIENFDKETSYPPIYEEDFENGTKSWKEYQLANIRWVRDHTQEILSRMEDEILNPHRHNAVVPVRRRGR